MRESFLLTLRALVRGRVLALLLGAIGLIHWLMPAFVRSDGTPEGALEMYVRAVPGFVTAVVLLTVLTAACGLFAREREERRLALTVVRPASALGIAAGKWLALTFLAGVALTVSAGLLLAFPPAQPPLNGTLPPCRHHYAPALPPPAVVAADLMESYLKDPSTPEAVRKASKRAVLTLLTTREIDRYDVIRPGGTMVWPFGLAGLREKVAAGEKLALRMRFSTQFELRTPVTGRLRLGNYAAAVTNNTQAVIEVPLVRAENPAEEERLDLVFENTGKTAVMVRPRRDIAVLAPADAFAGNLLRALLEVGALAALLAAYGLFLSAALSRPVAVFTALVTFTVVLIAPSVITQFPDEFNAPLADRIGLALSRAVQTVSASVSEPSPIADLATGKAVEWPDVMRAFLGNVLLLPPILLALAAGLIRRKPLADA